MEHDHHDTHAPPPIPFTPADEAAMRTDDVKAAKAIAGLTTGIFLVGIALYVTVLISVLVMSPVYAVR
jgi:hypothetical protein